MASRLSIVDVLLKDTDERNIARLFHLDPPVVQCASEWRRAGTLRFEPKLINHRWGNEDGVELSANQLQLPDDGEIEKRRRVAYGRHSTTVWRARATRKLFCLRVAPRIGFLPGVVKIFLQFLRTIVTLNGPLT